MSGKILIEGLKTNDRTDEQSTCLTETRANLAPEQRMTGWIDARVQMNQLNNEVENQDNETDEGFDDQIECTSIVAKDSNTTEEKNVQQITDQSTDECDVDEIESQSLIEKKKFFSC